MKFNITKENFLQPLQKLNSIISINHENPVMHHIYIHINSNQSYLMSTNLEIEFRIELNCNTIDQIGEILVSSKKILNIIRSFPKKANIKIIIQKEYIQLTFQKIFFSLRTLHTNNFPKFAQEKKKVFFYITQNEFKNIIYNTYFSMAKNDIRNYLNGINIKIKNQKILAIASDGYRMAISYVNIKYQPKKTISIIIPRKTILELIKILNNTNQMLKIIIHPKSILFIFQNYILTSKMIENKFPDYQQFLVKSFTKKIKVNREKLQQSLIRASIITNQTFQGVKITFKNTYCTVSTYNENEEQAKETFEVNDIHNKIELTMNINYILDVIKTIKKENITFLIQENNSNIYIQYKNIFKAFYIIMPLIL
ncbi:DNA polymerase III subunit beta [Buchnera aphidicola]|uniref:DNA polymerase III subunit beta n=1 Tax=Buchnera aphidicola TaxID=9 RepID=UPI0031B8127A